MAAFPSEGWVFRAEGPGFEISSKSGSEQQDLTVVLRGDGKISVVGTDQNKIAVQPPSTPGSKTIQLNIAIERSPKHHAKRGYLGTSRGSTAKVSGRWTWIQGRGKGDNVMYLYVALRHNVTGALVELQRPSLESICVKENSQSEILRFDRKALEWGADVSWMAPNLMWELERGGGTILTGAVNLALSSSTLDANLSTSSLASASEPREVTWQSSTVNTVSTSLKGGNIRKLKTKKQQKDLNSSKASPTRASPTDWRAVSATSTSSGIPGSEQLRMEHRERRRRSAELRAEEPAEAETVLYCQAGVHDGKVESIHQAHWRIRHIELQADGNVIFYTEHRSSVDPRKKELTKVVLCELGSGACIGLEPVELEGNLKFGLMLKFAEGRHTAAVQHLAFSTALERDVWMDQIQPYTNLNGALPLLPRTGKSSSSYGTRAMTGMSKGADRQPVNVLAKTKWFAHYVDDEDPTDTVNLRRQIRRGDLRAPRTLSSLDFHIDMTAKAMGHRREEVEKKEINERMLLAQAASIKGGMSPRDFRASRSWAGSTESPIGVYHASHSPAGQSHSQPAMHITTSPIALPGRRSAVLPQIVRMGRRNSMQSSEEDEPETSPNGRALQSDIHSPNGKFEDRCFTLLREMGLVRNRARRLRHSVDSDSSDSDEDHPHQNNEVRDMSKALLASPMFGYVYRRPLTADSESDDQDETWNMKEGQQEMVNWEVRGGLNNWLDDKVARQIKRQHRKEERQAKKEAEKKANRFKIVPHEAAAAGETSRDAGKWGGWETEEEKAEAILTRFPSTWITEAIAQIGDRAWVNMSWEERLLAVQALLLDANNLDQMLTEMTWKRDPLHNTVQIHGKRMVDLLHEVMEVCVRSRDTRQVLALLNSIENDDERQKIGLAVAEMASHGCLYDMVDALQNAGFEFVGEHLKRRLRSPGSVEEAPLPDKALRRLESRDARRRALRVPKKRAFSVDIDLGMEEGEEAKDMFEELLDEEEMEWEGRLGTSAPAATAQAASPRPDTKGSQAASRGNQSPTASRRGLASPGAAGSRRGSPPAGARSPLRVATPGAGAREAGGAEEHIDELDDDVEANGVTQQMEMEIRKLLRDGKSLQEIQEQVKKTDGSDVDMDVLSEIKEDWATNLLKDFPVDHPIKIFCAKLMSLSCDIFMGKWRLWHIGRRRKRERVHQQYLAMCDHYHLTPVGVQSIHRYMLSRTSSFMNLSGQGISKLAIKCMLEAFTGTGESLTGEAVDMCHLRSKLHDEPLTSLDLSSNDVQAEGAGLLAEVLTARGWKIKELILDGNNLREQGPQRLAPLLVQPADKNLAYELVKLSLAKNGIGDRGVAALAKLLHDNKHLRWLNLAGNGAGLYAGKALGQMVIANNTLNYLDLSFNMLRTEGAVAFAEGVAQNNHLQDVILAWNGFGDPIPCAALGRAIETFFVKTLDVSYNRIGKQGAVVLAGHLEKNSGIHRVVMDGNLISQGGARALFKAAKVASEGEDFAPEISIKDCGIGIVDQQAFDPSEPSGDYDLDMRDSFSRGVLVNLYRNYAAGKGHFVPLVGKTEFNATLDEIPFLIELPKYSYTDQDGKQISIINPDETEWVIPLEGILVFRYASIRVRDVSADTLDTASFKKILSVFKDHEKSHAARKEVMAMYLSLDTLVHYSQVVAWVEALYDKGHAENKDIRQTRAEIVSYCFHKLVETSRTRELLTLLDPEARKAAERMLGPSSFDFTRENPTGYYHLNLAEAGDRAICMVLQELRSLQIPRLRQIHKYYQNRTGGPRDELERVWRNVKFDGKVVPFDPAWRVPQAGTLELDFVQVTRPGTGTKPIGAGSFEDFLQNTLKPLAAAEEEGELVAKVRAKSDDFYFSCEQVYRILTILTKPNLRVEICVVAYARVVDWHAYKNLELVLSSTEQKLLRDRIGVVNLFDETMAVGFYELDLSDREQRFVAQEIVHLGHVEPGENMGDCTFNESDFDVPVSWVKGLPRQGMLHLYYIRDADVIKQVRLQGAYDHADSPMMADPSGAWYGEELFGTFAPTWLRGYRWHEGAELHEAVGEGWIREHKLRRIQKKLEEKFSSSQDAVKKLDKDGSGEMSRAEIAIGLFQLGIWLHPNEMEALMSVLDEDEGGEVDGAEFHQFWERYSGKDDVEQFERSRNERNDSMNPESSDGRRKRGSCLRRGSVGGPNTLGVQGLVSMGASKSDLLAALGTDTQVKSVKLNALSEED